MRAEGMTDVKFARPLRERIALLLYRGPVNKLNQIRSALAAARKTGVFYVRWFVRAKSSPPPCPTSSSSSSRDHSSFLTRRRAARSKSCRRMRRRRSQRWSQRRKRSANRSTKSRRTLRFIFSSGTLSFFPLARESRASFGPRVNKSSPSVLSAVRDDGYCLCL